MPIFFAVRCPHCQSNHYSWKAPYYRHVVSKAAFGRLDFLTWEKLRSWAHRRHPRKTGGWVKKRYWHRVDNRLAFATAVTGNRRQIVDLLERIVFVQRLNDAEAERC